MLRILETGFHNPGELTKDEQRQFVWWLANHFFMAEGFFHSHRAGLLSEDSWRAHERIVAGALRYDAVLRWWESGITPFSESFHSHIETVRRVGGESPWDYPQIGDIFREAK